MGQKGHRTTLHQFRLVAQCSQSQLQPLAQMLLVVSDPGQFAGIVGLASIDLLLKARAAIIQFGTLIVLAIPEKAHARGQAGLQTLAVRGNESICQVILNISRRLRPASRKILQQRLCPRISWPAGVQQH